MVGPMAHFSLSALGVDRPGIVAAVSGVLVDRGCNLEDSTMSILQGHFAILLVVSGPDHVDARALEASLAPVAERFDLTVAVRELELGGGAPGTAAATGRRPWTIAVHGADRTGIVHGITSAVAEAGGNLVDLSTHLVGAAATPVYVMTVRATFPEGPEAEAAASAAVRSAAESLGVRCTLHADDADTL